MTRRRRGRQHITERRGDTLLKGEVTHYKRGRQHVVEREAEGRGNDTTFGACESDLVRTVEFGKDSP